MRESTLYFLLLGLGMFLFAQTHKPYAGGTLTDITPDGMIINYENTEFRLSD